MTEFNLKQIMEKPVKELTNQEFYIRYKEVIKKNNKKNYKKYDFSKYVSEYQKRNKIKINAKSKAYYHIKIPLGQICEICEEKQATQKHHEDYSKPLEIVFLCRDCHAKADMERRENE